MPAPLTPDDFKNLIPAANSSLCRKFLEALVKLPTYVYQLVKYMFNDDGTLTDEFKQDIGVAVGQLTAPGGVSASDGAYDDHVTISWNPVGGATFYELYRGSTNDPSEATLLTTTTAPVTTYDDATVTDAIVYWYFVKAKTATDASGFSTGDSGFMDSTGGGGAGTSDPRTFNGNGTYVVPAGVATITVEAWGAGGGGGASGCPYCAVGYNFYGGGGGGAGEYMKVTGIPVSGGDTLSILVDSGGAGGVASGTSIGAGTAGGPSTVIKASDNLVVANGGNGGREGKTGGSNGAGGTGGTGGTNSAGVIDTQTAGDDGASGTAGNKSALPGSAGTGGSGASQNTGGGNGGGNGTWDGSGSKGSRGKIIITPSP